MNSKTNLAIAVAFVVAFGTYILVKYKEIPDAKKRAAMKTHVLEQLYDVAPDDVTEVDLKRGDEAFHFVHFAAGDRWQMTKPLDVLAESSRVRDIVNGLKNLQRKSARREKESDKLSIFEPKTSSELAQYKLDSPPKIVTLTYKSKGAKEANQTVTLQVGDTTADGEALYVKQPNESIVYVVGKNSLDSLEKKASDFRQHKLVTISRYDADKVHFQWPDRALSAEKKDNKWRLVDPFNDRADQNKLGDMLGKLADLKVDADADFVDDNATDDAKYGFNTPQLIAEVGKDSFIDEAKEKAEKEKAKDKDKKKDGEKKKEPVTEKILIGSAVEGQEGKVYAKVADQKYVVAVAASVLADLNKQPNDVRSRDLVEVTPTDVDYVAIERAAGTIVLAKKDFDWEIRQPKSTRAESSLVTELVKKIDDLEIKEFVDQGEAKDFGLDQPAVTVSLYQKGLKQDDKDKDSKDKAKKDEKKDEKSEEVSEPKGTPIKVLFGNRDEEKKLVYVKRGDESGVFAVSDEGLWELLDRDSLAYRRRQVLTFPEMDVTTLKVHRDGKTFSIEHQEEKQGDVPKKVWHMTEPVDAAADSQTMSDLLFNFSRLNAKKYIAEGVTDLKPYGLDEPKIRATVTLKPEGDKDHAQHVVLIGSEIEGDGDHYAKLGDGDLVFAVHKPFVNFLNAELHDRTLLKFDDFKVIGLTLTWPDAKLELANQKPEGKPAKEWSVVGNDEFKLDAQKPRDVARFLSSLSAEKFVQYQGDFKEEYGLASPLLVVEVKLEGESTAKTIHFGAAADGEKRYVAAGEKSGPVGLMSEDRVKDLISGPQHFAVTEEKKPEPANDEERKKKETKPDEAKPEEKKPEAKQEEPKAEEKKPEAKPDPKKDSDN